MSHGSRGTTRGQLQWQFFQHCHNRTYRNRGHKMTRSEWDAAMVRYMHRSDLSADLDQVFDYATSKIENAWMRKNVLSGTTPMFNSADDMLAYAPLPYLHAGLMYFQELVQDDEGMMREMTRF